MIRWDHGKANDGSITWIRREAANLLEKAPDFMGAGGIACGSGLDGRSLKKTFSRQQLHGNLAGVAGRVQMTRDEGCRMQQSFECLNGEPSSIMHQTLVITGDFRSSWGSADTEPYLTFGEVRLSMLKVAIMPANIERNGCELCFFTPDLRACFENGITRFSPDV